MAKTAREVMTGGALGPPGYPVASVPLLELEGVADEPEHWWPESDEEGSPLCVATLLLVDGFRADPQGDAELDRSQRCGVQVPAAQSCCSHGLGQHPRFVPRPWLRMQSGCPGTRRRWPTRG